MNLVKVSELDHASISNLARTERISYFDASYAHAAIEKKRDLVTDDLRLSRVASKFVSVKGSMDLPLRS
jgi:predicted nucleic acid-binding protein